jgi:hypothetical protein
VHCFLITGFQNDFLELRSPVEQQAPPAVRTVPFLGSFPFAYHEHLMHLAIFSFHFYHLMPVRSSQRMNPYMLARHEIARCVTYKYVILSCVGCLARITPLSYLRRSFVTTQYYNLAFPRILLPIVLTRVKPCHCFAAYMPIYTVKR